MRIILLVLLLACCRVIAAQETEPAKRHQFYGIIGGGYVAGASGAFPFATAVAGIDLRILKAGMGGGYDGYRFASFPVFIDIRKDLFSKKRVFGYAHSGYHFAKQNETISSWSMPGRESWKGGLYLDAGLGVHFKMFRSHRLNISIGYNYKRIKHDETYSFGCMMPPCEETKYQNIYGLRYLNTRLSWQIN